jgi:hypothetical protein
MQQTIAPPSAASSETPPSDTKAATVVAKAPQRAAWIIIGTALLLGVLADWWLRPTPWGLNVLLFTLALCSIPFAAARASHIRLSGGGRWLVIPSVLLAITYIWRDSPLLLTGNFLLLLTTLALFAWRAHAGRLRVGGLIDYGLGLFMGGLYAAFGVLVLLFQDVAWRHLAQPGRPSANALRTALRAGVGVLLALPLLLVFGLLFAAADAGFAQLMQDLFKLDMDELIKHLMLIAFMAWLAAGFLRLALIAPLLRGEVIEQPLSRATSRLGIVEIATVLGLLNVLFLTFVVLQFRYLFGAATAIGYAEYARRGFFELVTVAALALPVLLAAYALLAKDNPAHLHIFNALAVLLIVLLFVIMASALQRMGLYVNAFGLTELRIYTTAFMLWLAALLVWLSLTVLRGRANQFAFGALISAVVVALALNALNPDDLIARVNVSRATLVAPNVDKPRELDATYLASLSADALPTLMESLPGLPNPARCRTATIILGRWTAPESPDWRTWNLSRLRAWQLVREKQATLKQIACPLPRESGD